MSLLQLENIHASYGKKEVLRGVSLELDKGESLAIIGPNGAGKSTLLRVISGFLIPSEGKVLLDGQDIKHLHPHKRTHLGIGYLLQDGGVFPGLTVEENIAMGSLFLSSREKKEALNTVVELFPNLKELFPRRAGLLSGGQRQALALSIVLVRRPRLLLLDEPSAGLAPILTRDILQKVAQINQQWGTTILMVEQKIRDALNVVDRAFALVSGRIFLETSSPKDWLDNGRLEELFMGGILRNISNQ